MILLIIVLNNVALIIASWIGICYPQEFVKEKNKPDNYQNMVSVFIITLNERLEKEPHHF
jgi:hypothetical protein